MASWELDEFTAQRLERARRLLAGPGELQGSADLQRYVHVMDLSVALNRKMLGADGEPRAGLSEDEALQGLATCLCCFSRLLEGQYLSWFHLLPGCRTALVRAMRQVTGRLADGPSALLELLVASVLSLAVMQPGANSLAFPRLMDAAATVAWDWAANEAAARHLEQRQRAARADPVLTAAGIRRLLLLLHQHAAMRRIEGPAAAEAARSCTQLLQLEPSNSCFLWKHAQALLGLVGQQRLPEAAAAYRGVLQAAAATKGGAPPVPGITAVWCTCNLRWP
ncbi:hypothetical protein ABPG75_013838 [Micractinium tetrahymenae]